MTPNLELRINDKGTLFMGKKAMALSRNFIKAEESSETLNNPNKTWLELKYQPQEGFSPEDESERIYQFTQYHNIEGINNSPCPDELYTSEDQPRNYFNG